MRTGKENNMPPIIWVLLIVIGVGLLVSCSSLLKSKKSSPKANVVIPVGNHIQNLAAHEVVSIETISSVNELGSIPLWIDHDVQETKPKVYEGLFWEIEPMGEYLYFLAGDYKKNEKGLLKFMSATTSVRVETNFEDDVINVAKIDGAYDQEKSSKIVLDPDSTKGLSFGEIEKTSSKFTSINSTYFGDVSLKKIIPEGSPGRARLNFRKQTEYVDLTMIYEEFREPELASENERYLKIYLQSRNPSQNLDSALTLFSSLITKYSNMPYVHVSGSTRM